MSDYDPAVLREWLGAIKNHLYARGDLADLATIEDFTDSALAGDVPHWYTDEYRARVGKS